MKIKSISLIILFSIMFGLISHAQRISYGLSGGIDWVGIHVTEKFESLYGENFLEPTLNYNINGYLAYKGKGLMGVSIEPGYMRKGIINSRKGYLTTDETVYIFHSHIQLPVLADFHISERFIISLGLEFSYMISSKIVAGDITEKQDLSDNRFQLLGNIGIHYEIMKNMDIGLRYSNELPYYRERDYYFMYYAQFLVRFKIDKDLFTKSDKDQSF